MKTDIETRDLSEIKRLLFEVLGVEDYTKVERMGGLTNHTYHVYYGNDQEVVVRIPGDGTEKMIMRDNERVSTQLACNLGIDAKCIYFDSKGYKVTEYIEDAETMSAETIKAPEIIRQVARIYQTLHSCGVDTQVPFEVFDMASSYEKIINDNHVSMYDDYDEVKQEVMKIKNEIDAEYGRRLVPCHNDPLCENWVLGKKQLYLIDWEYAGMDDRFWDLADISIESGYSEKEDACLLESYLGCEPSSFDWKHFYASKIYVDYLWALWAKARVPFDGQSMEDWAAERYFRLIENIKVFDEVGGK